MSRELPVFAGLLVATAMLAMAGPGLASGLTARLAAMLSSPAATPGAAIGRAAGAMAFGAGPLMAAVLIAGSTVVLLQTGFLMRTKALVPDVTRLNPQRGLAKLFGPDNLIEALKALVKVGVLGWAAWRAIMDALPGASAAMWREPGTLASWLVPDLLHLCGLVLACQAAITVLDIAWVRHRFAQRMRMTEQEQKQEHRDAEGDPRLKAKVRQMRLARARRRMLAAVPTATVVVTNPTHYAVALAYAKGGQGAPRVVAKGMDEVAARIREAARKHGIPLVPNPPLARALHATEVDAEVPAEHFRAVAEIIAYVWRLNGRTR